MKLLECYSTERNSKHSQQSLIRLLGHELKSPIDAVEGYLEILEHRSLGHELASYDKVISRSRLRLQQMRELILDLLDITKIESKDQLRQICPVNLCEIVRSSFELYENQAKSKNISCKLIAPSELLFTGNKRELEIIINNLISNAIRYNRCNGNVTVTLNSDREVITIEVKDSGIGLSKEESEVVFDEFVRIRNENTKHILGTGLGLSLVRMLAETYNGSASVESVAEKGSIFTVKLREIFEE